MRDETVLLQIVEAARAIQAFTAGLDAAAFGADPLRQSAVLYQITIIGEAVKQRLSESFKTQHSILPWHAIGAMRNRVIHQYDSVDLAQVWAVVQQDMPALLAALTPLLPTPADPHDPAHGGAT